MKTCTKCGAQVEENVAFCPNCGSDMNAEAAQTTQTVETANGNFSGSEPVYQGDVVNGQIPVYQNPYENNGTITAIKVFMIIACVASVSMYCIPLLWIGPMTYFFFKKVKNGEPIGTGFKVCTLLFVNIIAGILMFTLPNFQQNNTQQF